MDIKDLNHGLMVRAFNHLFEKLNKLNSENEFCRVKASYLEIYNEKTKQLVRRDSQFKEVLQCFRDARRMYYLELQHLRGLLKIAKMAQDERIA